MRSLATRIAIISMVALFVTACGIPKEKHQKVVNAKEKLELALKKLQGLSADQKQRISALEGGVKLCYLLSAVPSVAEMRQLGAKRTPSSGLRGETRPEGSYRLSVGAVVMTTRASIFLHPT